MFPSGRGTPAVKNEHCSGTVILSQGQYGSLGAIWLRLETFLVVSTGEEGVATGIWWLRPGTLPNVLQCAGRFPQ